MCKCKLPLLVLEMVTLLLSGATAGAETWYLEQGRDWKPLSARCEKTLNKADRLFAEGKLDKAAYSYDKFLDTCDPNSELYAQALQRQFDIARQFLAGRKITVLGVLKIKAYARGEKMMEKLGKRAPNTKIGTDAAIEMAKSYEARAESNRSYYDLAYLKWSEILDTCDKGARTASSEPSGEVPKDALLAMARCKHGAFRGARYDASDLLGLPFSENGPLDSAKGCYEHFKLLYPTDAEKLGVDEKLQQINHQLADKDLDTAMYYQRTGNRQAANLYYQMVLRCWPETPAATMAKEMLSKNFGSD